MTKHTLIFFVFVFTYFNSNDQVIPDEKDIHVIVPYCGNIEWDTIKTDLNQNYWAVYQNKKNHNWDNFQIKKYDLNNAKIPKFLIKGLKFKDSVFATGQWINRMFFPGESQSFSVYNLKDEEHSKTYYIYASGKLIETKKREFPYFSKIENYQLHVVSIKDNARQRIRKMNIPSFSSGGFEGGVFIYWIGDLNGDNQLDMLVGISTHYAGIEYSLFLSDPNTETLFIEHKVGGCSSC